MKSKEIQREVKEPEPVLFKLTLRATILALIFLIISSFWLMYAELITLSCQITEAVPPITAIAFLLLLVLLNPLLQRISRTLALSRAEILIIYCFLAISTPMASCGVIRYFFPSLVVPFYFATPLNEYAHYWKYIPRWFAPRDREILRQMYEASDSGPLDWSLWGPWVKPLLLWTAFFFVFWFTMFCIMVILRKQWIEKEKLTFPLLYLPLDVTEQSDGRGAISGFFKNPIMWIGFGVAFLYNLSNIINAFNPSFATVGKFFDFGALFTEKPLDALRPLTLHYRPEMIGFGYLVSLEVSFSVWFFYLLQRLAAVFARAIGWEIAGFPFDQEQGAGVFIALAFFLLWVARGQIKEAFRQAFSRQSLPSDEPIPYRWAVFGTIFGMAFIILWSYKAGMALWLAPIYFGLIFAFALVYSRIRAETGAPLIWLFPFWQQEKILLNAFGSQPFVTLSGGNFATLTMISVFAFLPRGYFPELMAYQIESLKVSDEVKIKRSHMALVILLALIFGLFAAYYIHLYSYYEYGANILEGGTTEGGYRTQLAVQEFNLLRDYGKSPKLPDYKRTSATIIGFVLASALMVLRMIFLKFPLNPLGYAIATSYGYLVWGPFFVVWLIKLVVLKLGGIKLYKRLIPAFLGLALGHFFTAGIVWGTLGIMGGEAFRRYGVWFG